MVMQYLRSLEAHQEFSGIATPHRSLYFEVFHCIHEQEAIQRFDLESYYESNHTILGYMNFY
jgi:hypothetical protein